MDLVDELYAVIKKRGESIKDKEKLIKVKDEHISMLEGHILQRDAMLEELFEQMREEKI